MMKKKKSSVSNNCSDFNVLFVVFLAGHPVEFLNDIVLDLRRLFHRSGGIV